MTKRSQRCPLFSMRRGGQDALLAADLPSRTRLTGSSGSPWPAPCAGILSAPGCSRARCACPSRSNRVRTRSAWRCSIRAPASPPSGSPSRDAGPTAGTTSGPSKLGSRLGHQRRDRRLTGVLRVRILAQTCPDPSRLLGTDPTVSFRKNPALHCNSSRDRAGRDRETKKMEVPRQDNPRWVARCASTPQPLTSQGAEYGTSPEAGQARGKAVGRFTDMV